MADQTEVHKAIAHHYRELADLHEQLATETPKPKAKARFRRVPAPDIADVTDLDRARADAALRNGRLRRRVAP